MISGPPAVPSAARERVLLLAVAGLVVAACLPLARVFLGGGFLVPVVGGVLLALAVDWGARRLGAGPGLSLLASALAWALFAALAFLPDTLLLAVLPTPATLGALRDLWVEGLRLVPLTPSPTYPEPALLLLAVTGAWAVAHAVDGLVFRLAAPLAAIVLAIVLWTVPLSLAPPTGTAWLWAVPFLAAAAVLLLAYAGADLGRYGRWVRPDDPAGIRSPRTSLTASGGLLAGCAIVAGSLVAGSLPGFGEPPWYELRGSGGSSLTTNPIVGIHSRLVANDTAPVLRVTTPRPLYVRTTSLDTYDAEREVWTNGGVEGRPVRGPVPAPPPLPNEPVEVTLEVVDLPGGLLVPMPYQTLSVFDAAQSGERLRYDPGLSTFFMGGEQTLQPGDTFQAFAAMPAPTREDLEEPAAQAPPPELLALPDDLPPEVGALARDIVARAGATTPLEQAVAVQDELRSWTYSLDVVPNHRASAIAGFLERREGYCEQFAATMALMLRELGIPSRVAVGFTPGRPTQPELVGTGQPVTYTVSLANAHAWVEVLFPGRGWIAFEPTPRSDGNVLVPSAVNLAPDVTVTPPQGSVATTAPPVDDFQNRGQEPVPLQDRAPVQAPVQPAAGETGGALPVAAVLVAVAAAVVLALLWRRRAGAAPLEPLDRVLRARTRLRRLGAGLGVPPRAPETDDEYARRLLAEVSLPGGRQERDRAEAAAGLLARRAAQAQWAPTLPEGAAEVAEAAADVLESALVGGRPWWRRALIRARAAVARPPEGTPAAAAPAEEPHKRVLVRTR